MKQRHIDYQIFFKLMGFEDVTITENRLTGFDSKGYVCAYSIGVTGTISLNITLVNIIRNVISFLEPIDFNLIEFTYNGDSIDLESGIFDESFDQTLE